MATLKSATTEVVHRKVAASIIRAGDQINQRMQRADGVENALCSGGRNGRSG